MSSIIPTPGLLHGRLQSTLASSDRSSSNKKLYSTLPTKVDDIKVTAMRSFLMTGAVGRTRADIELAIALSLSLKTLTKVSHERNLYFAYLRLHMLV